MLSGQSGARISPRSCSAGLPRPIPPKPQHKDSCAGLVAGHCLLDQMTVAKEFCVNGTNSQIVTLQTSVVKQRNPLLENSSENDGSEEIIPSASAIISAIEHHGKLKQESSGRIDKKSRPSREVVRPVPNKKPADRKIPPPVPAKPFKSEQRRLLLVSLEKSTLTIFGAFRIIINIF